MVAEEGKIREFARATKSACPAHIRGRDPVPPVTFLASSQLWMAPENSPWRGIQRDFRYVLHGEQEFRFHGPPLAAGTRLRAHQAIERTYDKRGQRGGKMTFTEVVTRFTAEDTEDSLVVMRALSIQREPTRPGGAAQGGGAQASGRPTKPIAQGAAALEAAPGEGLPWLDHTEPPLTVTDFVGYQGASGDFNPIHHDTEFARAAGQPGPFAVGMLTASIAANLVSAKFGPDAVRRYRVRWHGKAWPGDALRYCGIQARDGSQVTLTVSRPDGAPHLTAWAELIKPGGD
jgi:acyl dehydratase